MAGQWFDAVVPPSASVVLFVQDWGGLLGLRLVASMPERFAAVIAANTGLPNGDAGASKAFMKWLKFSQTVEVLPVGMIVGGGTANGLSEEAVDAYDAPFATEEAKAGARQPQRSCRRRAGTPAPPKIAPSGVAPQLRQAVRDVFPTPTR